MGYWDATDQIIAQNGGENPVCPECGQTMFPIDDHGRFSCGCKPLFGGGFGLRMPLPKAIDNVLDIEKKRP